MTDTASGTAAVKPLPEELGKPLEDSLVHLVDNSAQVHATAKPAASPATYSATAKGWLGKFWPDKAHLDGLFAWEHMGNYVIDRRTGVKTFEAMPIYVRVGMHLLFVSGASYISYQRVEDLLTAQSVKQGKVYDQTGPGVKEHIEQFIAAYELSLEELLVRDLAGYPTFNSFFARRLHPTARPITSPDDPLIVTSPADCRLTVYNSVDEAKEFWIKGQKFSIGSLLLGEEGKTDERLAPVVNDTKAGLAICRLAPQDYHRFHAPVDGTIVSITDIHGELYSECRGWIPLTSAVNPQAINENLDVFTMNKRAVMLIDANLGPGRESVPVAFVAIGAMLVGSIGWSKKAGEKITKGECIGWFQYGGSTVISVFPSATGIVFDEDLVKNSQTSTETYVQVGMEIAKVV